MKRLIPILCQSPECERYRERERGRGRAGEQKHLSSKLASSPSCGHRIWRSETETGKAPSNRMKRYQEHHLQQVGNRLLVTTDINLEGLCIPLIPFTALSTQHCFFTILNSIQQARYLLYTGMQIFSIGNNGMALLWMKRQSGESRASIVIGLFGKLI